MTERQLQFRVGVFVLLAMVTGASLVILFSDIKSMWQETYALAIHFEEAPGLISGSPVKQNGLNIGRVRKVALDDEQGGVLVVIDINADHLLRVDTQPSLVQSLFGDTKIEFNAGVSEQVIPPNSRLEGISPTNPLEIVQSLEANVSQTLTALTDTSREWQKVASNMNKLVETKEGQLDDVIERTATSLATFQSTMENASVSLEQAGKTLTTATDTLSNINHLVSDPQLQQNIRRTVAALPAIAEETQQTIVSARTTIQEVSQNLETLNAAAAPLAGQSDLMARKLSGSLIQLESLLTEMNHFSQLLNREDGSLQQLATDPTLYQNLNRSTASLNALLTNLQPVISDAKIFADRIARHPELLGVSGVMKGSSGIKEPEGVKRAGYEVPAPR